MSKLKMAKTSIKAKQQIINYTPGAGINVRLRGKRLAGGRISLYLDYYEGYKFKEMEGEFVTNEKGEKIVTTYRKIEYLKKYIIENPQTPEEREINNQTLALAHGIRNNRESDYNHNPEGFVSPYKKKANFLDFCTQYHKAYNKGDIRMIGIAIKEFKIYNGSEFIQPTQVNENLLIGYRDYLLKKYHGESPNSVFRRFKKILKAATKEGFFTVSPAINISCPMPDGIPKAILMPDEIVKLSETPCPNDEIRRAFFFCLNTGLRFVDVNDLQFKHISNGAIKKSQIKTGREVIVDLNPTAIRLLGEIQSPETKVFNLPSINGCLKSLKAWAKRAKIDKNITWHSARHSFATILLMNSTDIKTVQSLLGHSKIEHTQKYTHVVNALKKAAVNTLPEMKNI